MKITNNKGQPLPLFFIFILVLLSCNKNKSYITVEKVLITDSIYIEKCTDFKFSTGTEFIFQNDTAFEFILWRNNYYCDSVINVYDIQNNKIAYNIPLPFYKLRMIYQPIYFKPFSIDSILVVFDANHIGYDSSIVLINRKGEIVKTYNINNGYIKTRTNLNPTTILFPQIYTENVYQNNKICFSLRRYDSKNDTLLPIVGYYDIKNEKFVVCEKLKLKHDNYYCNFIDTNIICISPNQNSNIYLWNISNNKITSKKFKSKLVDSLFLANNIPFYNKEEETLKYLEVEKNINTNYLCRLVLLPKNIFKDNFAIQLIYDDSYRYLGEVLLNDNNINLLLKNPITTIKPWNEYYFSFSEKPEKLKLIKIKNYKFKNWNIIDSKKNLDKDLLDYMKKKNKEAMCFIGNHKNLPSNDINKLFDFLRNKLLINDSTFSLITIRTDGCYHCNDYLFDFIDKNKMIFDKKNKAYVLIYDAFKNKDNLIIKKFMALNNQNIYFENVIYPLVHPFSENNPRLILVKNNKIVSDTIYMPNQLENLVKRLMDFYGYTTE